MVFLNQESKSKEAALDADGGDPTRDVEVLGGNTGWLRWWGDIAFYEVGGWGRSNYR